MIGPRAKLVLIGAVFAAPIAASLLTYRFWPPQPTANHGELLLPPESITRHGFADAQGVRFAFDDLTGKWILVVSDSGECAAACAAKLVALRQVRLALGRDAARVERVFVVDDGRRPDAALLAAFAGTVVAMSPPGAALPPGAAHDRAHIYLVDPRGNVMMRWPAAAEPRHLLDDLKRLLRASQIG